MAPGGSTRANSQEDLGQDEEEASRPIVSEPEPDTPKNGHAPPPTVKFIEPGTIILISFLTNKYKLFLLLNFGIISLLLI